MDEMINHLLASSLFGHMDRAQLTQLIVKMDRRVYPPGERLFRKDDAGDTMYYILKGEILIYLERQQADEEDIELNTYRTNQIFGELSPLDEKPRSASAKAQGELEVLILNRADLIDAINDNPQIGLAMMRSLVDRVRMTTDLVEKRTLGAGFRAPAQPPVAQIINRVEASSFDASDIKAASRIINVSQMMSEQEEAASRSEAQGAASEQDKPRFNMFAQLSERESENSHQETAANTPDVPNAPS